MGQGRHRTDAQLPGAPALEVLGGGFQAVQPDERALHVGEELRALIGRQQAPPYPLEQLEPIGPFQLRDQPADIGLGGMQRLRRCCHGAAEHDRAEGFDLIEIDGHIISA